MNEQRTDQWFSDRLGKLTASKMSHALDMTAKGAEGAKRKAYRLQLIAERLTGQSEPVFENAAMRHGTEYEPYARAAYEAETGEIVSESGFINHPKIEWSGASPDGYIGENGLIEIKCPSTITHIAYKLADQVPEEHKPQMLWQLACTGRNFCDFVSYDPRLPQELSLFVKRFEPSQEEIKAIEEQAQAFLQTVLDLYKQLTNDQQAA